MENWTSLSAYEMFDIGTQFAFVSSKQVRELITKATNRILPQTFKRCFVY